MKVIGRTDGGYLVEISGEEIYNIFENKEAVKIGTELNTDSFYKTLITIRGLQEDRVRYARDRAEKVIEMLDEIQNNVDALTLFEKLGDENI